MITVKTTLVLGAGASGWGFPSGRELRNNIITRLKNARGSIHDCLKRCGNDERHIQDFVRAFEHSAQPSIDLFLENRPDFQELGKIVIAQQLISCELEEQLRRLSHEEHWYEYLWRRLSGPRTTFPNNKLSIITFNYDRSLEHFLFLALKNSFNLSDDHCGTLLQKLEIVHVHGQLGELPYLNAAGVGRPYQNSISSDILTNAAKAIKIVHEGADDSPEFIRARELIREAERVYFLGFGYHETNVKRLGILECLQQAPLKRFLGSGFGLEPMECESIQNSLFKDRLRIAQAHDALSFLRKMVSL